MSNIHPIAQTKCLSGQPAIHVDHGWCMVTEVNGFERICFVEIGPDSFEFRCDVQELREVDPRRDLMPPKVATVTMLSR